MILAVKRQPLEPYPLEPGKMIQRGIDLFLVQAEMSRQTRLELLEELFAFIHVGEATLAQTMASRLDDANDLGEAEVEDEKSGFGRLVQWLTDLGEGVGAASDV
jgi:hypothetical protein